MNTEKTTWSAKPSETSSVTVELANHADLRTRLSRYALVPARLALMGAAAVLTASQSKQLLRAGRLLDPLGTVLTPPLGTRRRRVVFSNFRAEWLWQSGQPDPALPAEGRAAMLYFHGGAFFVGGLNTHRRLVARIAQAGGVPALNVEYRQLPGAHITDSLDDAIESYRYLLGRGFEPERIILAGDSAGGGLAFRLALATRELGLPMPAAISVISPWGDYDTAARKAHPNAGRDAYLPMLGIDAVVDVGLSVDGALDPRWSPVNHDFTGLPPVLIQVGSTEVLLSDAEQLARRCAEAGVPCKLQIWDRAVHVHQIGADLLPDARAAIRDMAAFHHEILADASEDATGTTAA
jgi:acetyl esterase/lipase